MRRALVMGLLLGGLPAAGPSGLPAGEAPGAPTTHLSGTAPGATSGNVPAEPVRRDDPVALSVNPARGSAVLLLQDPLASERVQGALDQGLPVRIRVVTELWRDRLVDSEVGRDEWKATVVHDPLEDEYRIEMEGTALERHRVESLEEARGLLTRAVPVGLRPGDAGQYYYLARMEVETLSLSDLEELQRWLRGDLGAAAEGEEGVESALRRGLRRAFIRLVGAPVERYQAESESFRYPPDG